MLHVLYDLLLLLRRTPLRGGLLLREESEEELEPDRPLLDDVDRLLLREEEDLDVLREYDEEEYDLERLRLSRSFLIGERPLRGGDRLALRRRGGRSRYLDSRRLGGDREGEALLARRRSELFLGGEATGLRASSSLPGSSGGSGGGTLLSSGDALRGRFRAKTSSPAGESLGLYRSVSSVSRV